MSPFSNAISAVGTFVSDAASTFAQHVNTAELVNAAVKGALEGIPNGPVGIGVDAFESIVADLPNITTPEDAKLFTAGLTFAQEIYARLHPPVPGA